MILGRSPALWLALVAAALNVVVVVFGIPLSDVQVLALNGLAFAVVGVIANESDPRTVPTFAPTLEDRRAGGATAADGELTPAEPAPVPATTDGPTPGAS